MPYNKLEQGANLINKYIVEKVLFTSETVSVYLGFDKKITGKYWVIKEFVFDTALSSEEIKGRREKISETMESLKLYDHKYITKIIEYFKSHNSDYLVSEYVEGVTLEEYINNYEGCLPEKQIIKWAIQLCDALHYFNDRPNPFIFGILDPTRIMANQNGDLKLINFGLNRLFGAMELPLFSGEQTYFGKELNSLGMFLIFLATKIKTTDPSALSEADISDDLKKIIIKCADPKIHLIYTSFDEIRTLLEGLIKKEAEKLIPKKHKITFKSVKEKISIKINNFLFTFSLQKTRYQIAEILGIILLAAMLYFVVYPNYKFTKSGPVVYILCGENEIISVNPDSFKVIDKLTTDLPVKCIKADSVGKKLYLSVSNGTLNKIQAIICKNNIFDPKIDITVDMDPRNILVDEPTRKLYVLNKKSNNISVVDLKLNKMTGLIPVGNNPFDIKDSALKPYIFSANSGAGTISVIDKNTEKITDTVKAGMSPSAIAVSKKLEKIFVGSLDISRINKYVFYYDERSEMEYSTAFIENAEGKKNIALFLDSAEKFLYAANYASNNVSIIDLADNKLKTAIYVGKNPIAMLFIAPNYLWVINYTSGTVTIINTYTHTIYKTFYIGKNPQCITYAP